MPAITFVSYRDGWKGVALGTNMERLCSCVPTRHDEGQGYDWYEDRCCYAEIGAGEQIQLSHTFQHC